jgi:hypothetical protein
MDHIKAREANERRLPQIMCAVPEGNDSLETREELAQDELGYFSKPIVC